MRFAGGNAQIGSETDSYTFAQKLVVGDGDDNDGITIQSGTTHQGNIAFNDGGTTAKGRLSYQHGSNYMQFFVNNAEKMRINSTTSASAPSIKISDTQPWIDMVAPDNSTLKAGNGSRHLEFFCTPRSFCNIFFIYKINHFQVQMTNETN